MSSLPKRLKITEGIKYVLLDTQVNCEYCGLEIQKGQQWDHIIRHQQGLQKLDNFNFEFEADKVLFPWYVHSIYQDRSVNRSRFEVIQFTELTQDSPFLAFEKLITKPFSTHFWINYKSDKIDDAVKNYFGLKPETVCYQISDHDYATIQTSSPEDSMYGFECCLCNKLVRRCPTLPQTLMSILIHVLNIHKKNKEIYDAAFEDIHAIQESTGLRTHLETAPNYNPLMASDLVFDMLHSENIYYLLKRGSPVVPTHCLFCFNITDHSQTRKLNNHMKSAHKANASYTSVNFASITNSRYGYHVAIPRKHRLDYLLIVFNENLKEFSWACVGCGCTLIHEDSTQLLIHLMAHWSKNLGGCHDKYTELYPFMLLETSRLLNTIRELFYPVSQYRSEIVSWNMLPLEPLEFADILDVFLSISFKTLFDLLHPITKQTIGLVQLCETLYQKKKSSRLDERNLFIHVCSFCFQYFLERDHVFLHMRPGECPEMKNFKIRLDAADLEKALENAN